MAQAAPIIVRPASAGVDSAREAALRIFEPRALSSIEAEAVERLWTATRRTTPRLFDGPLLVMHEDRLVDGRLAARRATYKTLVGAPALAWPVRAVGVQGIVVGRDRTGVEHVLLGQRSSETRIYGGMWENAASGTLPAPTTGVDELRASDITRALTDEGLEELGIDLSTLPPSAVTWIAMLDDGMACSEDFVLRVELQEAITPNRAACSLAGGDRWEYIDSAWVAASDVDTFIRQSPGAISPPTVELFRWLGWVKSDSTRGHGYITA